MTTPELVVAEITKGMLSDKREPEQTAAKAPSSASAQYQAMSRLGLISAVARQSKNTP